MDLITAEITVQILEAVRVAVSTRTTEDTMAVTAVATITPIAVTTAATTADIGITTKIITAAATAILNAPTIILGTPCNPRSDRWRH